MRTDSPWKNVPDLVKAAKAAPARGVVIEARLDKGRGPVGTVLVQEGTLKPGDYFVCGPQYGRARALFDDRGDKVEEVPPGLPAPPSPTMTGAFCFPTCGSARGKSRSATRDLQMPNAKWL